MNGRRRATRWLAALMVVAGVLLIADVVLTLVWKEPVGALKNRLYQTDREAELQALLSAPIKAGKAAARPLEVQESARRARNGAEPGRVVGQLVVPRISLRKPLLYGTGEATLADGPAIYTGSPFPGEPGTVAIAGHRTTHGADFRHIDRIKRGDRITVRMSYATLRYKVSGTRIVSPRDVWVLRARKHAKERLVLSACHPLFSADQRYVVFADLQAEAPN